MYRIVMLGIICLLALSCKESTGSVEKKTPDHIPIIHASNYPLYYFAQRLAPERADVRFIVEMGIDPVFWKPTAEDIIQLQKADLILLNGATYEKWRNAVSLPISIISVTSASFMDELVNIESAVTHNHGPEGEHSHSGTAFTTWIDLQLAIQHAKAVAHALLALFPSDVPAIEDRFTALENDLVGLDRDLKKLSPLFNGKLIIYSHPVFQYFERAYDLDGFSLHWEPDESVTEEQWQELAHQMDQDSDYVMIWEAVPMDETIRRLQSIGVRSLVFDPCSNRPVDGDFLTVMKKNVSRLQSAEFDE